MIIKKDKMKKNFSLILLSIVLTVCQAQETNLALNLEKGKEYRQVANSKVTLIQEFNGQKTNIGVTINGGALYRVTSVNPSDYDLDVKYESLSMMMELPQGKMEFSSDKKDESNILSQLLSKMTGHVFKVKMAKNGKVLEVKNVESLIESLFEDFSDIPENQLAQIKAQLINAYGTDAFKGNIEMVTAIFPDNPVNKGDHWTIKTNLKSGGMSAQMTTDYQLMELTSDYAMLRGNSIMETANNDTYIESNGMQMKYDMSGTMISEIKVDRTSGWIIEANLNQEIKGNTYIKENPQMPNGMKIPMTMINEMTMTDN